MQKMVVLRLSPCLECSLCSFGNFPGVWIYKRTSFTLLQERIHYNRRELNRISGLLLQLHLRLTSCLSSSHWDLTDRLTFNKATQIGELARKRQLHKFASLHTSQHSDNKTIKGTVINLSNQELDEGVYSLLQKGLNYAITPRSPPIEDLLTGVEKAVRILPSEMAGEARQETVRIIKHATINFRRRGNSQKNRLYAKDFVQFSHMVDKHTSSSLVIW